MLNNLRQLLESTEKIVDLDSEELDISGAVNSAHIRDIFLSDPQAMVIGSEHDPAITKFIASVPEDDDANPISDDAVKKLTESISVMNDDYVMEGVNLKKGGVATASSSFDGLTKQYNECFDKAEAYEKAKEYKQANTWYRKAERLNRQMKSKCDDIPEDDLKDKIRLLASLSPTPNNVYHILKLKSATRVRCKYILDEDYEYIASKIHLTSKGGK